MIRVGTAGWSIPRAVADRFATEGSGLQRYAGRFSFVEINTSFYRSHQRKTYERWAADTPPGFRLSVKLIRTATHERRLIDAGDVLERFFGEVTGLGDKLGPIVVQLPPSLAFDKTIAGTFFTDLRARHAGDVACEPRHHSWFTPQAVALLATHRIARIAADPAVAPEAAIPDGHHAFTYRRLHGSPAMYRSAYGPEVLDDLAAAVKAEPRPAWIVFDNTTLGHAAADALSLMERL